jgi:SAM-dependent methyltransferase
MLKLDLGAGEIPRPGFVPLGRGHGSEIYPLPYADESVDEIVASHVLEHFPHGQVETVLKDWVRALKKGGHLRIAVPDFAKIATGYLEGAAQPTEGWLLGGQTDANDYHQALFDHDKLKRLFSACDLVLLRPWEADIDDCSAFPISLNLEGYKPHQSELRVTGAMSVPRLGFTDNMFCAIEAAVACNVRFKKHGGAFWGQSLTNVFEHILDEGDTDCILAVDYDSIFTPKHLATLMQLMMLHPEIDALAPIQSSRHLKSTLFTVRGDDGNEPLIRRTDMAPDTMPIHTAHFGLTLIRTEKLRQLPKPWFHSVPSAAGEWKDGDGHIDEDIQFWRKWEEQGFSLHLANRVAIGHAELQVKWPDINLETFHQSMGDFQKTGVPDDVWK